VRSEDGIGKALRVEEKKRNIKRGDRGGWVITSHWQDGGEALNEITQRVGALMRRRRRKRAKAGSKRMKPRITRRA